MELTHPFHTFHEFTSAVSREVIVRINKDLPIALTVIQCSYNRPLHKIDNDTIVFRLEWRLGRIGER